MSIRGWYFQINWTSRLFLHYPRAVFYGTPPVVPPETGTSGKKPQVLFGTGHVLVSFDISRMVSSWTQRKGELFFGKNTPTKTEFQIFREESLSYKKKCTSYCSSAVSWTSSFWLFIFPLQNPVHLHLRIFCDVPSCSNPSDAEVERCGRPLSSVGGVTSWWERFVGSGKVESREAGILGGSSHLVSGDRITPIYKPWRFGHLEGE